MTSRTSRLTAGLALTISLTLTSATIAHHAPATHAHHHTDDHPHDTLLTIQLTALAGIFAGLLSTLTLTIALIERPYHRWRTNHRTIILEEITHDA